MTKKRGDKYNSFRNVRREDECMQLMLKNEPVLQIEDSGECIILDFARLSFALRREKLCDRGLGYK